MSCHYFTGNIPKQIGRLNLEVLNIATNHFSGSLPRELGNLSAMRQAWLDVNNFNGIMLTLYVFLSYM